MTSSLQPRDLLQTRSKRAVAVHRCLMWAAWLICSAAPAGAAWQPVGVPVDLRPGDHTEPRLVPDGSGGVYVVWQHYDGTTLNVRVQHLDANADPAAGWSAGGAVLAPPGAFRHVMGAGTDAAGGLLVGWSEFADARAKRLGPDGSTPPGWDANGNVLWLLGRDEPFRYFGADGAGGAWSVHRDTSGVCTNECTYTSTEHVNHVDAAGVVSGDLGTLGSMSFVTFQQPTPILGVSSAGELLLAVIGVAPSTDLTRSLLPSVPQWHALLGSTDSEVSGIADDGAGGALLVTRGGPVANSAPPHVLRLDATGAVAAGWPASGLPFRTPQVAISPFLGISDGASGILIGWGEAGGFRVQRITGAGTPAAGWPADGVVVNSAPGAHTNLTLVADGAGGAWVAWRDRRSDPNGDVYATHVFGDGQLDPAFPINGLGVATHPGREALSLARTAPGVAVIAWSEVDIPATTRHLVYVQRLPVIGPLSAPPVAVGSLTLAGFTPNPAHRAFRVTFTLPAAGDATLDVFDLVGRRVVHDERRDLPAGSNSIRLAAAASWPPGVYLVRLRTVSGERFARGLYLP